MAKKEKHEKIEPNFEECKFFTTPEWPKIYTLALQDIASGIRSSFVLSAYGLDKSEHFWGIPRNIFDTFRRAAELFFIKKCTKNMLMHLERENEGLAVANTYRSIIDSFRRDLDCSADKQVQESFLTEAADDSIEALQEKLKDQGIIYDGVVLRHRKTRTRARA